ncbi:multicopper oxidase family protein [Streptomyces prunicolor]|uniref:multicopper oxidase family protein n=1 Tax=Streptomyces prunicolor TaxID=67348 RepID=UPI00371F6BBE
MRLLNGSTARTLNFGFDDSRTFSLIATDGGLLDAPAAMDRLQLSPGERAEVVVRMKPGEHTVLRTYPLDIGLNSWTQRFNGGDDTFDVLELRAAAEFTPSPDLPTQLAHLDLPTGKNPARTRTFDLQGVRINGKAMDMNRVDARVTRGTEEIWKITNTDGAPHNFHVHDVRFKILDVDGKTPPAHLRGAKDTVFLPPQTTVRIARSGVPACSASASAHFSVSWSQEHPWAPEMMKGRFGFLRTAPHQRLCRVGTTGFEPATP